MQMATIGATTLGEILPSSMGATTLDAVAGVVRKRPRSPRRSRSPRSPRRRAPAKRARAASPQSQRIRDRISAASEELADTRKLLTHARDVARKAETEKKALERKVASLQKRVAAAKASLTKRATARRARS